MGRIWIFRSENREDILLRCDKNSDLKKKIKKEGSEGNFSLTDSGTI